MDTPLHIKARVESLIRLPQYQMPSDHENVQKRDHALTSNNDNLNMDANEDNDEKLVFRFSYSPPPTPKQVSVFHESQESMDKRFHHEMEEAGLIVDMVCQYAKLMMSKMENGVMSDLQ